MKTIYLVILAISVYAACPNLCSGHGTCDKDGYCTCNRQPGLGLNKGSFEEYSWTGYDCSERTCPKGQTFSYDDELYVASTAGSANYDTLQTTSASSRVRLLFESDGGRQAADADGETTPTEADDEKSSPPTSTPTASTASPTPVNTTSPPIITEAPVVATEAPKVEIDDIVKERPIQDSLPILKEIIGDSSTSSAPVEFVILRCYLGKNLDVYLGEITINPKQRTNTSVLLDKFGIDDGNAIVNCNVPFTSTKVSKPSAVNPKESKTTEIADVITSTGKVAKNEPVYVTKLGSADDKADEDSAVANKNDILTKLQDVYGTLNLTGLFDTKGRMLADDGCYGLNDSEILEYEYLCVESENPNDGAAFYRMQKVPGYVRCNGSELELIVSQNEMDSIDGLCYFFGDVDAQLPYSEIYPWIGKSDGYYYFGRYNEKATTIIAQIDLGEGSENVEGDTKLILNLTTVPSMVKGGSEFTYNNRPIGEIQLASTKGAQMSIQLYNKETGTFSRPIITTLESSYINTTGGGLNLEITVSPTTPIANNGTLNTDDGDDSTNEDNEGNGATGTDSRMLWEDYQGRELYPDDNHVILLNILKVGGPHTYMECSGRGTCDRATGQCQCYNGFEGDACQRTSCPNACSNNGRCVQMHSDDTDQSFESKFFGCECDAGFRGPDCSMLECPSAEDPNGATNFDDDGEYRDCSGRGICDYTTGLCKCFSGYYGTACETQAMLQ